MPSNTRSKTTRVADDKSRQRPVSLDVATRYINVEGRSEAGVAAAALSKALGVAGDVAQQGFIASEKRGFQEAVNTRATGGPQDEKMMAKNAGYRRAWAQLDAENDFNKAELEIEEGLRELDFDNMDEQQVQDYLTEQFQSRFGGADQDPDYAEKIAPALLGFEEKVLNRHRQQTIDKIKESQSVKTMENLRSRWAASKTAENPQGSFDYAYLAESTREFFDGDERTNAYATMLFGTAIDEGRPDLIDDMPDRYPSGAPTIKNNPEWQEKIRSARGRAEDAQVARMNREAAALKAQRIAERDAITREAFGVVLSGQHPGDQLRQLAGNEEVDGALMFAIESAYRSTRDDQEVRAADRRVTGNMWNGIYANTVTEADVFSAWGAGYLGRGPAAEQNMKDMMSKIEAVRKSRSEGTNPLITTYNSNLTTRFNPDRQGISVPGESLMRTVLAESQREFFERVHNGGEDPTKVFGEVVEKYDNVVATAGQNRLTTSVTSESNKIDAHGTRAIKEVLAGTRDVSTLPPITSGALRYLVGLNQISQEEALAIADLL